MQNFSVINIRGVLFNHDGNDIPAFYMDAKPEPIIALFRLLMTDAEIEKIGNNFNPDWQRMVMSYAGNEQKISTHDDELWQQTLVDFQKPIYGDERMVFERGVYPTIYCSKAWLREFVKFYNGQHEWSYGSDATPVYKYGGVVEYTKIEYTYYINSCPIEIVERDDIWAQYTIMNQRMTSLGHAVTRDDLREV